IRYNDACEHVFHTYDDPVRNTLTALIGHSDHILGLLDGRDHHHWISEIQTCPIHEEVARPTRDLGMQYGTISCADRQVISKVEPEWIIDRQESGHCCAS